FPLKLKKINRQCQNKAWVNVQITEQGKKLCHLHKKYLESNNPQLLAMYKNCKRLYKQNIINVKRQLIISSKNQTKEAWKIMNESRVKKKQGIQSLPEKFVDSDGNEVSGLNSIANCFNTYFRDSVAHIVGQTALNLSKPYITIQNYLN